MFFLAQYKEEACSPRVPGRQHETEEEKTFRKGANTKKKKKERERERRNKECALNPLPTPPSSGVKFRGLSEKLSPVKGTSSSIRSLYPI